MSGPSANALLAYYRRVSPLKSKHERFVLYIAVGVFGLVINQAILMVSIYMGVSYLIAGVLSRVLSTLANYTINDAVTWGEMGASGWRQWVIRCSKYVITRGVAMVFDYIVYVALVALFGVHPFVSNVIALGVGVFWGFGLSEGWVWNPEDEIPSEEAEAEAEVAD